MITLTALVRNVFPTNEFTDQKTGVITAAGHKVQLEYEEYVGKGGDKKLCLDDFNVHQLGDSWRKAMGKNVNIAGVGVYIKEGGRDWAYFLPKGVVPTLAA